jgi:hypothetical protein
MTPVFFARWVTTVFRVDQRFACRLWAELDVSPTLLYQISLCDSSEAPVEVWRARMNRLRQLVLPEDLMAASVRVSAENGRPRMPSAVKFEDELLKLLDRNGGWRN